MISINKETRINQKQYLHLQEKLASNSRIIYRKKQHYIIPTDTDAVNYLKSYLKVKDEPKPAEPKPEKKETKRTGFRKKKKDSE
ncbi:MAG: hypothetical protein GWN62_16960 [Aliifodinibius sp.]|nr:hypothetical protein [Fodinibius sp.]